MPSRRPVRPAPCILLPLSGFSQAKTQAMPARRSNSSLTLCPGLLPSSHPSPQFKQTLPARTKATPVTRSPVPILGGDSLFNYRPQAPEDKGGNRNQETKLLSKKTNPEINTETFNYHKPRSQNASIRMQSTTVRTICHHQNPVSLL